MQSGEMQAGRPNAFIVNNLSTINVENGGERLASSELLIPDSHQELLGHPGCELSRNLNYQGASRSSHILTWQTSWTNRFEGLVGEDELLVSEALRATLHSGGHV